MTISSIFSNAASALIANQEALRITSTNISNVGSPGYVRQDAVFQPRVLAGGTGGVDVGSIRRTADRFLQNSVLRAQAGATANETLAEFLNRAQANFGDPSQPDSVFNRLDALFTAFTDLTADPASAPRRATAINNLQETLAGLRTISGNLDALAREADARLVSGVNRANSLLTRIAGLNREIVRFTATGQDASGVETQQRLAIDELSRLIDLRTTPRTLGGVEIRTVDGVLLLGEEPAQFVYAGGTANANQEFGEIGIVPPNIQGASARPVQDSIGGGELRGLIDARDRELPALRAGLSELAAGLADALNAAHNSAAALPPPPVLNGRNTGLLATNSLGFSGRTTIAVVNASGNLVASAQIDLSTLATVNDVVTAINAALGGAANASFANGRLTIAAGGAGNGIVVADATSPVSDRAGRGFSQFFGLNDLVSSPTPLFFETGAAGTDSLGVTAGSLTLEVRSAQGAVRSATVISPAGLSVQGFVNALNADPALNSSFSFSLSPAGELLATPLPGQGGNRLAVTSDTSVRGDTGLTLSSFFGLSRAARDSRVSGLDIRTDIQANRNLLAAGVPALTSAAPGDRVLTPGDGTGANALAAAFETSRLFAPEGLSAATATIADFAARLAGEAGERAAAAERTRDGAVALSEEAISRRISIEGVNLDEELVRLTQFQQSYAAAARLIQAADELLQTLLQIGA